MEGYTKIASFMGQHPESAMTLRFSDINLQSILYLQAEIYGLRQDLRLEERENAALPDLKRQALNWHLLAHDSESGEKTERWKKIEQLRHLLKEYSTHREGHCATICRLPSSTELSQMMRF